MKSALTLVVLLVILWGALALSGTSFALTTKPQASGGGGCRSVAT